MYLNILKENIFTFSEKISLRTEFTFQPDNDPKHAFKNFQY